MSKTTWKGGRDLRHVQQKIRDQERAIHEGALLALEKSVEDGAVALQDILEASYTKTGLRRQAQTGGFPGRHDTGNMIGSTSYDDRSRVPSRGKRVMMAFGWFRGEFEQYFRDQDLGEGNIPAARALPAAFVVAEQAFRRRLYALFRGGVVE